MARRKVPDGAGAGSPLLLPDLIRASPELQQARRLVVGFSGGLDSTVLLHLLHAARAAGSVTAPLEALHVNHGLQAEAGGWEHACRQRCEALGVSFYSARVTVAPAQGESLEESARNARHAAFAANLRAGDVLVLAHHRDDQAETILLRLLRGSGPAGLAAMAQGRACGAGRIARPLLDVARAELLEYARAHGLSWSDDPSNANERFDRNFLRARVLPLLQERWPGAANALARSARLAAETAELADALGAIDVAGAAHTRPEQLAIDALSRFSEPRQRNALRYWLQTLCARHGWAAPTHQVLARVVTEVIGAASDAEPLLSWGEGPAAVELRRHRGALYLLAPLPPPPAGLTWSTRSPLALPAPLGMLELRRVDGPGLACARVHQLQVRFRGGGELVKAAGRPLRPLKKILQEAGVPSWLRERIPLLYAGDELVAVGDLLVCEAWLGTAPEDCCRVVWNHPDLDCGYTPHLLI